MASGRRMPTGSKMADQKCSSERVALKMTLIDEIDDEEGDALQIDDEELAGEGGDGEED